MVWTATLTGKREEHGRIWIEVTYEQDGVIHVRTHNLTNTKPSFVKRLLQADVNQFDAVDPLEFNHPIGTTIDLTPDVVPPPDPPTQDEIDKETWFNDYEKLQAYKRLVDHGVNPTGADTQIANLQASLLATWKNAYASEL